MKQAILDYLRRDYVTFAELSRSIEGFRATNDDTTALHPADYPTIIYWYVSKAGADAILSLLKSGEIEAFPAHQLSYLFDGAFLDHPIARAVRQYKKPRWAPVCLRLKGKVKHD